MRTLRNHKITEYVNSRNICSIKELVDIFDVSLATIQRDVADLVRDGAIRKVHGGVAALPSHADASAAPEKTSVLHDHFRERLGIHSEQKAVVAQQALAEIRDGDIVFMDSSTTVYHLVQALRDASFTSLTLVTNSVLVLREFPLFPPSFCLIGMGGNYDIQLNAFLGRQTLRELENLSFDKAFISAVGLDADGLYSRHENHAAFLGQVLERSRRNYLLVDGSKFDRSGIFKIASLGRIDMIVSDQPPPDYARRPVASASAPESETIFRTSSETIPSIAAR